MTGFLFWSRPSLGQCREGWGCHAFGAGWPTLPASHQDLSSYPQSRDHWWGHRPSSSFQQEGDRLSEVLALRRTQFSLFRFRNRQNSTQLPARIPLAPGSSSPPGPGSAYSGTTPSPMPRPLRATDARVTAPWSKCHYLTSREEPKAQRTAAISLRSASKWGTGALDLTLFAMDIQPKTATAKLWLKQKWNFFSRVPFIPDGSTRFEKESCMVVSGNFQKNFKLDFSWLLIPL